MNKDLKLLRFKNLQNTEDNYFISFKNIDKKSIKKLESIVTN